MTTPAVSAQDILNATTTNRERNPFRIGNHECIITDAKLFTSANRKDMFVTEFKVMNSKGGAYLLPKSDEVAAGITASTLSNPHNKGETVSIAHSKNHEFPNYFSGDIKAFLVAAKTTLLNLVAAEDAVENQKALIDHYRQYGWDLTKNDLTSDEVVAFLGNASFDPKNPTRSDDARNMFLGIPVRVSLTRSKAGARSTKKGDDAILEYPSINGVSADVAARMMEEYAAA